MSEAQNYRKDRKKQKISAPPLLRITRCNLIQSDLWHSAGSERHKKIAMVTGSEIFFVLCLKCFQNQVFITYSINTFAHGSKEGI
ncbi:hypothetical protein C0J52_21496 [Blattella germanica]|nr:hypothetical protein C0J52_21496 [Blattella germanica]